eukprot:GEMP01077938.1.p2 GENE.GEMP01077938.1~~GEMP01077938.1.p2  ORF type:complete len:161 (+),score=27.56 GEMP01077938.1:201-683(+)
MTLFLMNTFCDEVIRAYQNSNVLREAMKCFEQACFYAASKCFTRIGFPVEAFVRECVPAEGVSVAQLTEAIASEARTMGFAKVWIEGSHVCVQWPRRQDEDKPIGNLKRTCAICDSDRSMVALRPCGHCMCHSCANRLESPVCPFCRASSTGYLALFLPS